MTQIDIDSLTIAQVRQIAALAGSLAQTAAPNPTAAPKPSPFAGKYVICRCYSAGVHTGTLVSQDGDIVVLENSRRLWKWKAKQGLALSGVAVHGIDRAESKIDTAVSQIMLTGVIEIIPTTDVARESIDAC